MNKAIKRAKERYWLELNNIETQKKYVAYVEGYLQAEKDLELSWEDIEKITDIWDDLHEDETVYIKTGCDTPEFYQEVLKRFKEKK